MFDGYVLDRTEYVHPSRVPGGPLLDDRGAVWSALRESVDTARGRTRDLIDQAAAEVQAERAR